MSTMIGASAGPSSPRGSAISSAWEADALLLAVEGK